MVRPLGPYPQTLTCPNCGTRITTVVRTGPNLHTHIIVLLLCLIGCWVCAPCVYCVDECLVKKHYCPYCYQYLGTYEE